MDFITKTKLDNLHVDSVDLCNRGANQYADVKLYKNAQGKGGSSMVRKNWLQRLTDRIYKSDAKKMDDYATPKEQIDYITKALAASFDSIADAEIPDAEKSAALVKSTAECMDFLSKASDTWFDTEEMPEEPMVEEPKEEVQEIETEEKTPAESKEVEKSNENEREDEDYMKYADFDVDNMPAEDLKTLKRLTKAYCKGCDEEEVDKKCCNTKKSECADGSCEEVDKKCVKKGDEAEATEEEAYAGNAILEKAMDDIEEMRKQNEALQQELEMLKMKDVAKEYECTGQDVEELTKTLFDMKKSSSTAYADHIRLLDQIKKSYDGGIFKTYGSDKAYTVEETNTLDAVVDTICKSNPDLSRAQAIVMAYQQNPGLPEYK